MNCTERQELVAAHALGALDRPDLAKVEAMVASDPDAKTELACFNDVSAALAAAFSTLTQPPPELKDRILRRLSNHPQSPHAAEHPPVPAGFQLVLNDATGWTAGPLPGFRVKPLAVSRDMGYRVLLAELAPGARFPEHDHDSSEELFIISGHLHTEGRVLGPGDFLHAEPGTHHHELVSPDGCVAMLIDRAPASA